MSKCLGVRSKTRRGLQFLQVNCFRTDTKVCFTTRIRGSYERKGTSWESHEFESKTRYEIRLPPF